VVSHDAGPRSGRSSAMALSHHQARWGPSTASLPCGWYWAIRWAPGVWLYCLHLIVVSCWAAVRPTYDAVFRSVRSWGSDRWCAVLLFSGSLVGVKAVFFMVEGAVLHVAAKVVVWHAWHASLAAVMVVGASVAGSICETCILCFSLLMMVLQGVPELLLVVGHSVHRWVR
jgi:hypothetical protein